MKYKKEKRLWKEQTFMGFVIGTAGCIITGVQFKAMFDSITQLEMWVNSLLLAFGLFMIFAAGYILYSSTLMMMIKALKKDLMELPEEKE